MSVVLMSQSLLFASSLDGQFQISLQVVDGLLVNRLGSLDLLLTTQKLLVEGGYLILQAKRSFDVDVRNFFCLFKFGF